MFGLLLLVCMVCMFAAFVCFIQEPAVVQVNFSLFSIHNLQLIWHCKPRANKAQKTTQ